jgi:hypothetical protein
VGSAQHHVPSGYLLEMIEACVVEFLNNRFNKNVFSLSLNPRVLTNEDVYTIPNLPYNTISNQGEGIDISIPNERSVLG